MSWTTVAILVTGVTAIGENVLAQSTLMSSLQTAAPAPIAELTASGMDVGLAGLWIDPTSSPKATGAFFSISHFSYTSVALYQAVLAGELGPRWSMSMGSIEIRGLFDSALVAESPELNNLVARSLWLRGDATVATRYLTGSVGFTYADDENVGDVQTSTVANLHLRTAIIGEPRVSIGLHAARVIGGSLPGKRDGNLRLDVALQQRLGSFTGSLDVAASRGRLWRYSEYQGSYAVAAKVSWMNVFEVGLGLGRYSLSYGTSHEYSRSIGSRLVLNRVSIALRYSSTKLGLGSGYAIAIGYESNSVPSH